MSILKDKQGVQPEVRKAFKDLNVSAPINVTEEVTLPMAAEADLAGGADLGDVIAKVNAILAKLRTAGLLGV